MPTPTNLYEYYTQQGQALPTVQARSSIYEQAGLGAANTYQGTAAQNTSLLSYLQQPKPAPTPTTQTYTPPPAITSANTEPAPQTPYVPPATIPQYPTQGLANTTAAPVIQPLSETQQAIQGLVDQNVGINQELVGEQAFRSQQEAQYGIPELTKTQNDLRAQQQAILNEQTAIQLNAPRSGQGGISTVLINKQYDTKIRENAVRALGISSLLAASQGNLTYAQSLVDKAVEQKYGPQKAQYEANLRSIDLLLKSPRLTEEERARAEATKERTEAKQRALETQEQNFKEIWNVATTASSNGANFTPIPQYPSLALALKAISEAPSKEQALQIASATGLLSAPAPSPSSPAGTPKILGNSTTGYYTYDASTGQTTPISNPNQPLPIPTTQPSTTPVSTTTPTAPTTTYKFTNTQLNSGSAKAGLTLEQFKTLDPDVQNFYVNATKDNVSDLQSAIAQVKSGDIDAEDAKKEIDALNLSTPVKEYFKTLIDQATPPKEESDFKWWNPLTWF